MNSTVHILNAHMLRTYPEAHFKTDIYVCTYETHVNGNPIDYERSVSIFRISGTNQSINKSASN